MKKWLLILVSLIVLIVGCKNKTPTETAQEKTYEEQLSQVKHIIDFLKYMCYNFLLESSPEANKSIEADKS